MCTVLQQHLNRMTNGYSSEPVNPGGGDGSGVLGSDTPSTAIYHHHRLGSPARSTPQASYSYLQDPVTLKRPVDVYDRKISAPGRMAHYHIPVNPDGSRIPSRSRSTYMQQLYGRRARSYSRTGMRAMVDELQYTAPRPRSPHMNNEEPINLSHYPDGRKPEENEEKPAPIERDDFPAPPFAYAVEGSAKRSRRWSEPGKDGEGQPGSENGGGRSPTTAETNGREEVDDGVCEEDGDEEEEMVDEKLDKNEAELRKISTGMSQVFLTELAIERERRRSAKKRLMDPRSSARTPSANREPHYRLRYHSPVNASPSRIADHAHPWDDDGPEGTVSRRSYTPYLPVHPGALIGRAPSPGESIKQGGQGQRPSRFSPYEAGVKTYSTDFSQSDLSEAGGQEVKLDTSMVGLTTSQPHMASVGGSRPQSAGEAGKSSPNLNRSLPDMPGTHRDSISSSIVIPMASNVYPLHLLVTTNYRLPLDVDRANLETHLSDMEFDSVFKMSRDAFYQQPYWKRCDMKRKNLLF